MTLSLEGRVVVVTRGRGGEDELSTRLVALGAEVRDVPAISFAPPDDPSSLDDALRNLSSFEWVVFASATAVERTLERLDRLGIPRASLAGRRLAAVGSATARKLEELLRAPDLTPDESSGKGLAVALAPQVGGRRVLLPRPREGRVELVEGLRKAGADLVAVEAYRTVPADRTTFEELGRWLGARAVDAIAFASPSAVKAVVCGLGEKGGLLKGTLLASIGPTTAEALRELGLSADIEPSRPTVRDLAEAIASRLGSR